MLWKSSLLLRSKVPDHIQPLFQEQLPDCQLPMLSYSDHENAFDEIALLGFPLCSPFTLLQHEQNHYIPAGDFHKYTGQTISALGYLVCTKGIHTSKGIPMSFGTFMDVNSDFIDTVHFPDILRKYPFQKNGFYILQGKITEEYDVYIMEVSYMRKIGYFEDKPE